jgi:hypothetical protein
MVRKTPTGLPQYRAVSQEENLVLLMRGVLNWIFLWRSEELTSHNAILE